MIMTGFNQQSFNHSALILEVYLGSEIIKYVVFEKNNQFHQNLSVIL